MNYGPIAESNRLVQTRKREKLPSKAIDTQYPQLRFFFNIWFEFYLDNKASAKSAES